MATLDKKNPVYVYCLSGNRSGKVASKMMELGFTKVIEIEGEMKKMANGTITRGKKKRKINHYNEI
jgi:rhodanese-related sulfurtransferase